MGDEVGELVAVMIVSATVKLIWFEMAEARKNSQKH